MLMLLLSGLSYGAAAAKGEAEAVDVLDPVETTLMALQVEMLSLKKRISLLEDIVITSNDMDAQLKEQLVNTFKVRSIEDDVQQNKEDIVDIRMDNGRQDVLLSQTMNMINVMNSTLDERLTKAEDFSAQLKGELDEKFGAVELEVDQLQQDLEAVQLNFGIEVEEPAK